MLVCNKRKSILSESVLTVIPYIELNRNSAGIIKVCNKRVSVIIRSILTKFYCAYGFVDDVIFSQNPRHGSSNSLGGGSSWASDNMTALCLVNVASCC